MVKVGLTGGIGSGKTAVARIFNVLGIPVFDADIEAKLLMAKDQELILSIQETFGEKTYTNGKLNKAYLADIVFSDPFKLEVLSAMVHPATIHAANDWMIRQKSPYAIKEAALMFEAGSASNLDYIVGVYAPKPLRVKRVIERDRVTSEQVLKRMNHQIDDAIKMKLCDFVVINDEQKLLIPQVLQLHQTFLELANKKY